MWHKPPCLCRQPGPVSALSSPGKFYISRGSRLSPTFLMPATVPPRKQALLREGGLRPAVFLLPTQKEAFSPLQPSPQPAE